MQTIAMLVCLLALCSCKDAVDIIINKSGSAVKIEVTTTDGDLLVRSLPDQGQFAFSSRRGSEWRIARAVVTGADGRVIGQYSRDQNQTGTSALPAKLKIIVHADRLEIVSSKEVVKKSNTRG
jgi:hypothetical protein